MGSSTVHEKLDEAMAENEKLRREYKIKTESFESLKRAYDEQLIKIEEERTKNCRELRQRDDVLLKIEEENRKLEDQLKWKKEQFTHLVEAHEKIKQQFREREKEWEKEKQAFFDEISTLNSNLDSQTRISEDLRTRFQMCNQALAHEETRRKFLETQLSESKMFFNNVSAEYEEAKSRIDSLANQRDKEIANLREALGTKEAKYKETEYRFRKLEQEKHDLIASLKELQEAIIKENGNGNSSVSKLRKNLKGKEAQLKIKDSVITELKKELQSCDSLTLELTLRNEETSVMLLVLKSHLSEVKNREMKNREMKNREGEKQSISTLTKQLDKKTSALVRAEKDLEDEREKVAMMSARIESYQEQLTKTESEFKEAKEELERANEELADVLYEGNESEFELQIWKSIAERLKSSLDENLQMRRKVEASLFAQMDVEVDLRHMLAEKEIEVSELKQKIFFLDNNKNLLDLQRDLQREELEEAERNHESEKQSFLERIESLEQEFENRTSGFLSSLVQMQAETDKFQRTREALIEAVVLKDIEIEEKSMIISELENEFGILNKLMGFSERISQLSMEDMQLSKELGRIMQSFDVKRGNELFDPVKENLMNISPYPTKIAVEAAMPEERSPLRAINKF